MQVMFLVKNGYLLRFLRKKVTKDLFVTKNMCTFAAENDY